MKTSDSRDRSSGDRSSRFRMSRYFDIHPPVFWPSAALALLFIAVSLIVGEPMEAVFAAVQDFISTNFGWLLILAVNFFVIVALYLAFSRYGRIRLGGKNAVPEFSRMSWFAMLFSAGMGIGILFWSVAEPIYHYTDPPLGEALGPQAAQEAMKTTFLHWGLHPWAVYAVVGMALAFFAYNRGQPLAIRSVFYPLLGDRIRGFWGHAIDVLAVLATLFGLATSLGFGVQQINAGLGHLAGIPQSAGVQVILVAAITGVATLSVASGLDQGVKRLSEINLRLGAALLVFVLVAGPTVFILKTLIQNTGAYVDGFFRLSTWADGYWDTGWQNQWTVFYWAWWISWSPFVGMFIARISRGRTLREFVLSVLVVPTLLTFLWITAFGGSALWFELQGIGRVAEAVQDNVAISLFELLANLPFGLVAGGAAVLLVVSFFVTSSDSGSLVVDTFTSGGTLSSPVTQRIFWAVLQGGVAATLLLGGGLGALQTAAIITGLPFAVVLMVMGFSLGKGLKKEYEAEELRELSVERESYEQLVGELLEDEEDG